MWIHPPYWNIIRYSDHPHDLSNLPTYSEFQTGLQVCLERCYAALATGGRLAVLVGDVRHRGTYTPIVRNVLNLEGRIGQLRSIVIKVQHNCRSDRTEYDRMEDARISHEYCVIFKRTGAGRRRRWP